MALEIFFPLLFLYEKLRNAEFLNLSIYYSTKRPPKEDFYSAIIFSLNYGLDCLICIFSSLPRRAFSVIFEIFYAGSNHQILRGLLNLCWENFPIGTNFAWESVGFL